MARDRLETILAQARKLSPDELAQLIRQATDLLMQRRQSVLHKDSHYASLFGVGKGSFSNRDEADRFIRGERDAWGE